MDDRAPLAACCRDRAARLRCGEYRLIVAQAIIVRTVTVCGCCNRVHEEDRRGESVAGRDDRDLIALRALFLPNKRIVESELRRVLAENGDRLALGLELSYVADRP